MKRRDFLQAVSAGAVTAGFSIDALAAANVIGRQESRRASADEQGLLWEPPFDGLPILQSPSHEGITVFACVNALCTAWVEYGETPDLGSQALGTEHGLRTLSDRIHRIRIRGLRPGTKYYYRVMLAPIDFKGPYTITRGAAVASELRHFTTLDDGRGENLAFNVINDTHEKPDVLHAMAAMTAAHSADMTFWNGDVFDDVRSDQQIIDRMLRPSLAAEGAGFASGTPLCFVSGNHDVRGVHARQLDRFIDVPDGRRYHLLRHGPAAILVLDTGEDKPDDHPVYAELGDFAAYRDQQRRWLEQAVRDPRFVEARYRIVIQHIPMFGEAASEDARAKWHPILHQSKIDLMVCGHVHQYRWHKPDDQRAYAQVVGGGPSMASATFIRVEANRQAMTVRVLDAAGKLIEDHRLQPRST